MMGVFNDLYPEAHNFCRVFKLPEHFPEGYLFGTPKPVHFLMVDWFNPWPEHTDTEPKNWAECADMLVEFLQQKKYVQPGRRYVLITEFGESLIFTGAKK